MNFDHIQLQLNPRAWSRQVLDLRREGKAVPPSVVDLALELSGDLPTLTRTEQQPDACDHDFEHFEDWEGDPSIPNGVREFWVRRCVICDHEEEGPPPDPVDDFDPLAHDDRPD